MRNATLSLVAFVAATLAIFARIYTGSFGWITAIVSLVVFFAFYGLLEKGRSEAGSWALGSAGQAILVGVWFLVLVLVFLAPWELVWLRG